MTNRTLAMTNRTSAIGTPYFGYRFSCQATELIEAILTYPQGAPR